MTHPRAVKIAVAAMRRELRVIAFDASMARVYGATYPQARTAARRQRELRAAIEELQGDLNNAISR